MSVWYDPLGSDVPTRLAAFIWLSRGVRFPSLTQIFNLYTMMIIITLGLAAILLAWYFENQNLKRNE